MISGHCSGYVVLALSCFLLSTGASGPKRVSGPNDRLIQMSLVHGIQQVEINSFRMVSQQILSGQSPQELQLLQFVVGDNRLTSATMNGLKPTLKRDIVFVLDSSASISTSDFELTKTSIIDFISSTCPNELSIDGKQVSVVLFGQKTQTSVSFKDNSKGAEEIKGQIFRIPHQYGWSTGTADAIKHVRLNVLPYSRKSLDVSKEVVVLTDGYCNVRCDQLKEEAGALSKHASVFAMGIGQRVQDDELMLITQSTNTKHIFHYSTFQNFNDMVKQAVQFKQNFKKQGMDPCMPVVFYDKL